MLLHTLLIPNDLRYVPGIVTWCCGMVAVDEDAMDEDAVDEDAVTISYSTVSSRDNDDDVVV